VSEVGWSILFIVVFTGLSLFFGLNNLALRTFSRVKLQDAFKAANKEALTEALMDNVERLILTCSFFQIVSNIVILMLLMTLLKDIHYIFTFLIAVVILLLFVRAIPHSWAKHKGEYILSRTYRLLLFFSYIAAPVIYVFRLHDEFVRRLAGVHEVTPDEAQEEKQEEILSVVEEGKMEGLVDEEEMEMIENVLELGDTNAGQIMTPRTDMVAVKVDDDLSDILETISRAGHSRIPVYEDNIDNIIGLVYAKDLLGQIGKDPKDFKLRDKMRKAYFVPETKPLPALLHEFQNQKLHISVVLDEYGGTAGIVTIEDILEELVGEITDEYEKTPPSAMKKINDSTVEIDARMYIDDLNEEFEVSLPEDEDYDTVGGFVFSHLGYIPKTGEKFDYENLKFTIAAAETRKIKLIRIEKLQAQKPSGQ
jgi:CBS domain containing-hemolysin-like protein